MHARNFVQIEVCLVALLSILASTSFAIENVTLTTKAGVTYETVTLTVDHDLQVVNMISGTVELMIGFGAIESIIDATGRDVTSDLLGKTERGYDKIPGAVYGTVVTKAGVRYDDIAIKVDAAVQIISLIRDSEEVKIGYGAVESITDHTGRDITNELLGRKVKSVIPAEYGTVVTKSGDVYRDVHIRADKSVGIITIIRGDTETQLGFSAIESITSESGRDITGDMLGEASREKHTKPSASLYGMLETKSGHVFEMATLLIDRDREIVTVKKGDDETMVRFGEIESITDLSGNDVTAIYLYSSMVMDEDGMIVPVGPGLRRYKAKPWHIGLSMLGAVSKPAGKYYEGGGGGGGYELNLFMATKGGMALKFMVAKAGMHFKETPTLPPGIHAEIATMKFMFGSQYMLPYPCDMKPWKFLFRSTGGLGLVSTEVSVKGEFFDPEIGYSTYIDESESLVNFALHFDFGTVFLLRSFVGLDLSFAFNWIYGRDGPYGVYVSNDGFLFDFRGGIVFLL